MEARGRTRTRCALIRPDEGGKRPSAAETPDEDAGFFLAVFQRQHPHVRRDGAVQRALQRREKMYSDGKNKIYHWCPNHNQWSIHTAAECKRIKPTRGKKDYDKNKKVIKRQNFKDKKQAYIQAKAAYEACLGLDSDDEQDTMDSDNDKGSHWLASSYSSEGRNDS